MSVRGQFPFFWLGAWFCAAIWSGGEEAPFELSRALGHPTSGHPLGFDAFGRDLLALALRGSLTSAGFALASVATSCLCALAAGISMALAPARWNFLLLRLLDGLLAFPALLLALAWAAVRGPGWDTLIVSLSLGVWPGLTRLITVRTRELLTEPYIEAARACGASPWRIARRHLAPALASVCAIAAPGLFAHALLGEATLSFLGVGVPVGRESWGSLLAQGRDYLIESPHLSVGAGVPLVFTVLSLQLISDSLTGRHVKR